MQRTLQLLCGLLLLTFLVNSCSDDPNSVGLGILPPMDKMKIFSFDTTAVASSSYLQRVTGNRNRLLVGRNHTDTAVTLFRFSQLPKFSSYRIENAALKFTITYRFPDSTGVFAAEVREYHREFSQATFTWDSLSAALIGSRAGGLSDTLITSRDSLLNIPLDTSFIRTMTDSGSATLLLLPSRSGFILGFENYEDFLVYLGPKLVISIRDSLDSLTTVEYTPSQRVFVANGTINIPPTRMVVQSGISARSILKFDVAKIPDRASITQALMFIRLDSTLSLRSTFATNVLHMNMLLDTASLPAVSSLGATGVVSFDSLGYFLKLDVKNIVQQWVTGQANYGVVLRSAEELIALERYVFYGASASSVFRPTLQVKYTVLP